MYLLGVRTNLCLQSKHTIQFMLAQGTNNRSPLVTLDGKAAIPLVF